MLYVNSFSRSDGEGCVPGVKSGTLTVTEQPARAEARAAAARAIFFMPLTLPAEPDAVVMGS
ncbi:hypothetical protein GCM10008019_42800 [Deinococcus soli (ex Cha et al. 2016)]|nr:hypothetical protein GCM10008019_42800 [Deinococcus soli (ex Cha et al. 2016)]